MEKAIDQVMYAYTLINHLTPDEAQAARERLRGHLTGMKADERALAVEGMRYLRRADRDARQRPTPNSL